MPLAIALLAAAAGAVALERLHVPGGVILGSMAGAAVVTAVAGGGELQLPRPVVTVAAIVIGAEVGGSITRQFLAALPRLAVGALLSSSLIIAAGLAIAFLLRQLGVVPDGASLLSTSPGALTALTALATERGVGAEVAVFHTARIVLVLATLPIFVRLFPDL